MDLLRLTNRKKRFKFFQFLLDLKRLCNYHFSHKLKNSMGKWFVFSCFDGEMFFNGSKLLTTPNDAQMPTERWLSSKQAIYLFVLISMSATIEFLSLSVFVCRFLALLTITYKNTLAICQMFCLIHISIVNESQCNRFRIKHISWVLISYIYFFFSIIKFLFWNSWLDNFRLNLFSKFR